MNTAGRVREEIVGLGYSAVMADYAFSDIFASPPRNRAVSLAAFTHTPPSYRNAALAVVADVDRTPEQLISECRALGAPLLFVIEGDQITAWQVRFDGRPQIEARVSEDQLPRLFFEHRDVWGPHSIQRAKSIGQINRSYQLSFVDAGLLTAIEGEIHANLDRLLHDTLAGAIATQTEVRRINERSLFRTVFRFLAAKILHDRSHLLASSWNSDNIDSVLDAISQYYGLPLLGRDAYEHDVFTSAWNNLRSGINFQNISADDLAFVYENTLVTPNTRKELGTHSTPWQVVEYIVERLELGTYARGQINVYEPCAGAAVFLVSALRHLREALPVDWTDEQRHNFLINHVFGDEVDAFAVEVAKLSLILADYPNHNGWQINEVDLFRDGVLASRMEAHNAIVCNPPFGTFTTRERSEYALARTSPHSKPSSVLNAALDAHPLALGFVLPRAFILEPRYAAERCRIGQLYTSVELVDLPDGTFRESEAGAALLIAHGQRPHGATRASIVSTDVADHDLSQFLKTGDVTAQRRVVRSVEEISGGSLWTPRLAEIWEYLEGNPRLGGLFETHLGQRWTYQQDAAVLDVPRDGFAPGLFNADDVAQFQVRKIRFIDVDPTHLTHAKGRPWGNPKIVANAARLSRGPWRLAAAVDRSGLAFSQQLLGLWPRESGGHLESIAAILNSPIGSAFVTTQSPSERFRLATLDTLPLPRGLPDQLDRLVAEYTAILGEDSFALGDDGRLQIILTKIDAAVLEAYDLPPRLERELLEFFRSAERPTIHQWRHWLPERFQPSIPLHKFISEEFQKATKPWAKEVFRPLPEDEAAALREYVD